MDAFQAAEFAKASLVLTLTLAGPMLLASLVVGVAVGLFLTKYSVPMLGAFLLEDEMYNAPLFAGAAAFLFIVAAASALVPALRATRVDPTESLRSE